MFLPECMSPLRIDKVQEIDTFVCIGDLQVPYVPSDVVLVAGCIPTQDIEQNAGMLQCLAAVVALHEADHLRRNLSLVLQPPHLPYPLRQRSILTRGTERAHLQAGVETKYDLRLGVDEFLLHQLEGGERSAELLPLERVLASAVYAIFECAHSTP